MSTVEMGRLFMDSAEAWIRRNRAHLIVWDGLDVDIDMSLGRLMDEQYSPVALDASPVVHTPTGDFLPCGCSVMYTVSDGENVRTVSRCVPTCVNVP